MDRDAESLRRRIRRLRELGKKGEKDGLFRGVKGTIEEVWQEGKQPAALRLRHNFVIDRVDVDRQPPASRLLNPRGIALRFYLLALFEAQCRLDPGAEWTGDRSFRGRHGWKDFVAVDVGYNSATDTYTHAPPRAHLHLAPSRAFSSSPPSPAAGLTAMSRTGTSWSTRDSLWTPWRSA